MTLKSRAEQGEKIIFDSMENKGVKTAREALATLSQSPSYETRAAVIILTNRTPREWGERAGQLDRDLDILTDFLTSEDL